MHGLSFHQGIVAPPPHANMFCRLLHQGHKMLATTTNHEITDLTVLHIMCAIMESSSWANNHPLLHLPKAY